MSPDCFLFNYCITNTVDKIELDILLSDSIDSALLNVSLLLLSASILPNR